MTTRALRWTLGLAAAIALLPAVAAYVAPGRIGLVDRIDAARLVAAARQAPNFTVGQHQAITAEIRSQLHPLWKNLSWSARLSRVAMLAKRYLQAQSAIAPVPAAFVGNQTIISNPGGFVALNRQPDCSLTLYNGSFTIGVSPTLQATNSVSGYGLALHDAAGLATRAGVFARGCADPTLGIGGRSAVFLGRTAQNLLLGAASRYDVGAGDTELYTTAFSPTSTAMQPVTPNLSLPGVTQVTAGDLNGDGMADIVAFNPLAGTVSVWLVSANGTIGPAATYPVPGNYTEAVVVADVTGDGRADIVAATSSSQGQEMISVLPGRGNGTFGAAATFNLPTPPAPVVGASTQIRNLIAADLRGTGHLDVVASNGLVLLNNGNGTATVGSSAFPPQLATSASSPNLVAADFNRDGKPDLAVDNGTRISIYLGTGTGTFTAAGSYTSVGNVGYLAASDLDGDGNIDLYTGLGNGGFFTGDQFSPDLAYVLMGNGDGSFRGAPSLPFVYSGRNLVDLTGSGVLDAVGVDAGGAFTSYLGDGKGGFSAHASLSYTPVMIAGKSYSVSGIESYALGDVDGDGKPDLVYIGTDFTGPGFLPGVFVALGDGHGGFAAPTFQAVASPLASGDIDVAFTIYNLHVADVNHDGKADIVYNFDDTSYKTNTTYFGTSVQLGNGDGSFQAPSVIPYRSAPYSSFPATETSYVQLVADLNHDGFPDLVFIAQSPTIDSNLSTYVSTIQVALGRGDGSFTTPATVNGPDIMVQSFTDVVPASLAVADMNGDGIPDLVALGASSSYGSQVAIALGNGDGTFKAPLLTNYSTQYLNNEQGIAVGDFNGDGRPDVLITNPYDPAGSGISPGNGDGTLQTATANGVTLPVSVINVDVSGAVYAADFNGDGKADLLAGNVLLLSQPGVPQPSYANGRLTLPILHIGTAQFSNVVVTIGKILAGPSGTTPASGAAVYDPQTGRLTVPVASVGSGVYYNTVAAVGGLVSIGSVSGADTFDGAHLTIPAVQVVGGSSYGNVVVTVGGIVSVGGGMPAQTQDSYSPATHRLTIPAVLYHGTVYTNVVVTVGSIISTGPAG